MGWADGWREEDEDEDGLMGWDDEHEWGGGGLGRDDGWR